MRDKAALCLTVQRAEPGLQSRPSHIPPHRRTPCSLPGNTVVVLGADAIHMGSASKQYLLPSSRPWHQVYGSQRRDRLNRVRLLPLPLSLNSCTLKPTLTFLYGKVSPRVERPLRFLALELPRAFFPFYAEFWFLGSLRQGDWWLPKGQWEK